jgi:hypothetical protein
MEYKPKFVNAYQGKEMRKIKYGLARALGCNPHEAKYLSGLTNPHFIKALWRKVKNGQTKSVVQNPEN